MIGNPYLAPAVSYAPADDIAATMEMTPWDLVPELWEVTPDPGSVEWPMRPRTYSICCCAYWVLNGDDDPESLACCYDDTVAAGLVWC